MNQADDSNPGSLEPTAADSYTPPPGYVLKPSPAFLEFAEVVGRLLAEKWQREQTAAAAALSQDARPSDDPICTDP